MNHRLISVLLLLVLSLNIVTALQCIHDENPFVYETPGKGGDALCTVEDSSNTECYTYLRDPDDPSDVWGGLPEPRALEGVGVVNYYPVVDRMVVVSFSRERLAYNKTVTGVVVCGGESGEYNFTPLFIDYEEVGEGSLYWMHNAGYIIAGFFLFFLLTVIVILIWGFSK